MKKILFILFTLLSVFGVKSQQISTVQPTIMVVPYTREGEDIRNVIESDVNKRLVLTSIKEAFDERGFTTIDFIGKFKAMSNAAGFTDRNQKELVDEIIANAGADIYVTSEININGSQQGNSVNILLTAYDTSTGQSLANLVGDSGRFYTSDIGKLANNAIKKNMDGFLNTLQNKFNDIVANGKSIMVTIGIDEGSAYLMSNEVGDDGDLLSEAIENWMEDNAYKNVCHSTGSTERSIIFDDVRIPLKYVNERGQERNYKINNFAKSMRLFFKQLGLEVGQPQINGNQLYISIK